MQKRLSFIAILLSLIIIFSAVPETTAAAASTCTWIGGIGNWGVSTNWDCAHIPENNDLVIIDDPAAIVNQDGPTNGLASLTLSAGTLTSAATYNLDIAALNISGGTLSGKGDIVHLGTLNWSGGTISRIASTLTVGGGGSSVNLSGDLVLNNLTLTLSSNSVTIDQTGSGSLTGNGTVNTTGKISKTGTGSFSINTTVYTNTADITVSAGELNLTFSSGVSNNAQYSISAGARLVLSGTQTYSNNSAFSGAGTVEFASGTATVSNSYNITGGTVVSGATVNLNHASTVALGTTLTLSGGTLNLGPKNVTLTSMDWSGGTLSGTGTTTVNSSISLSNGLTLSGVTLAASSSTTVSVSTSGSLSGTSGSFNLAGSLTKTGATTFSISGITFNNTGSVSVEAGKLAIVLTSGTSSAGTYAVAPNATLSLSGAHVLDTDATISGTTAGAGTVEFTGGSFTISSGYDLSGGETGLVGATSLSGNSSVSLSGLATVNLGSSLEMGGTSLDLGANNITLESLTWSKGTITGAGTATVNTSLSLGGNLILDGYSLETGNSPDVTTVTIGGAGSLGGTGTFDMSGALTKNSADTTFTVSGVTFNNTGGVTVAAGTLDITLPSGGSSNSGTYQVNSGAFLNLGGDTYEFYGNATISGAGTVTFTSGVIAVNDYELAGTTILEGTGTAVNITYPLPVKTSSGDFSVAQGSLSFNGSHTFSSAASFSGSGTITFTSGTFTINGDYELSGETILNGDSLTLAINYPTSTGTSSGKYTVTQGALTFSGGHTFAAGSDFSGAGSVTFTSGNVTINGDYELSGATILNDSGSGLSVSITYPVVDPIPASSGDFIVTAGSLTLARDHTFASGADFSGSGSVTFASGAMTISGSYSLGTGASTASAATVDMSALTAVDLGDSLTLTGGELDLGANDVTLTGLDWSGGTIKGTGTVTVQDTVSLSNALVLSGNTLTTGTITTTVTASGIGSLSGSGTFDMSGVMTKSAEGSFVISGITFNNTGSVSVTAGTLVVELPVGSTNDGTYSVSGSTTLNLSGPLTVGDVATIGGAVTGTGTVNFTAGNLALASSYNLNGGATVVSGAAVDMSAATSINLGDPLTLSAGSLDLGINSVTLTGMTWSGGTLTGDGTVTVNSTLALSGNLTLTGVKLATGSSTLVTATGTGSLSGTGTFTLSGALTKTGSGVFNITGISFNNSGSVSVSAGTLGIALTSTDPGSGVYSISADALLAFSGDHTFPAATTISGTGAASFSSGTFIVSGSYSISGQTSLNNANLTISYPNADPAGITSGAFSVDSESGLTILGGDETFTGSFSGVGGLTFSTENPNTAHFAIGGAYTFGGTTTVASGATLTFSSAQTLTSVIDGSGAVSFNGGSSTISAAYTLSGATTISSPASLAFSSDQTLTSAIGGNGVVSFTGGSSTISAAYTLSGATTISSPAIVAFSSAQTLTSAIDGSGAVSFTGGSSTISAAYTLSGATTISSPANVAFSSAQTLTSAIGGSGAVSFTGGSSTISAAYTLSGATTISSPATVAFNSAQTLTSNIGGNGAVSFSGGTSTINGNYTLSGTTTVASGAVLNFNGDKTLAGAITGQGGVTFSSGTFSLNSSSYSISGTTSLSSATVTIRYPNADPAGVSSGAFSVGTGSELTMIGGDENFSGAFSGSGNITFTTESPNNASFTINGTYSLSGTTTVALGATLDFNGDQTPNGAITGEGNITFTSGTSTITGAYTLSGTTSLVGADVTINYPASPAGSSSGSFSVDASSSLTLSGNISFSGNFSGSGNITFDPGTIIFSSGSSYNLSGGITVVNGAAVSMSALTAVSLGDTLTLTGGSLALGANDISLVTLNWNNGTLSGSGAITVATTISLNGNPVLDGNTLTTTSGTSQLMVNGTGSLTGNGTLDLQGTLSKTGSGDFSITGVTFNNTGSVSVNGGTLILHLPSGNTNTGTYSVDTGAILDLSAPTVLTEITSIGGSGTVKFTAGIFAVTSSYDMSGGSTEINGASVDLSGISGPVLGNLLTMTAGTLNLGSQMVTLININWSGGTVTGVNGGQVTVNGTGTVANLSGTLILNNIALQVNQATAIDQPGSTQGSLTGSGKLVQIGGLTKTNNGTFSISGITFINTISVNAAGGTLEIALDSLDNGLGTYTSSTGATLNFSGDYTFAAGASISGAGTVGFTSGSLVINSDYTVSGSTELNSSGVNVTINYSASVPQSNSPFNVSSGTLTFYGDHTFLSGAGFTGGGVVAFASGTVSIQSTINLTGELSVSNSSVDISQATITNLCDSLNLTAGSLNLGGKTVSVNSLTWNGGTLSGTKTLTVNNSASFDQTLVLTDLGLNIGSAVTVTITNGGSLTGSGALNLAGSLAKNGGNDFTISGIAFTNTGSVDITGGTLSIALQKGSAGDGSYSLAESTTLYLSGPATAPDVATIAGSIAGSGTVEFTTGRLDITGDYDLSGGGSGTSGQTIVTAATVDLSGATTVNLGSRLSISGGSLDLGGHSVTLTDLSWTGGTLSGSGSGTVSVTSTLLLSGNLALDSTNLSPASNIAITLDGTGSLTGGGTFTVSGSLTKTSAGSFDLGGIEFDNQGTVTVVEGTLLVGLKSGETTTGTFTVDSGASLFLAGDHTFSSNSTISGAGTVTFTSGTIIINSIYGVSGETILNGAALSLTINFSASSTSTGKFTVTQGALIFNGDHTFSSGADISGADTVEFHSGTINIASTYTLSGASSRTIVSGATVNLGGITGITLGSTLTESAGSLALGSNNVGLSTLDWSGGVIAGTGKATVNTSLALQNNLTLNGYILETSGSPPVSITAAGSLTGTGSFNLGSSLTKSLSGVFTINIGNFNNTGTVSVTGGTLVIALPDGTSTSGAYTVGSGAGLSLSGTHTFSGSATFSGAGAVTFTSGTLTINAGYDIEGNTTINGTGLAVTINYPAITTSHGDFTVTQGSMIFTGSHDFDSNAELTGAGAITFGSGSVSIAGSYNLTGSTTIVNSSLDLSSAGTVNFGNTLNFSGSALILGSHTIAVSHMTWSGGSITGTGSLEVSGDLGLSNALTLNNTLNIDSGVGVTIAGNGSLAGSGTFALAGNLTKSGAGTSFSFSAAHFNNTGSIAVNSGSLAISLQTGTSNSGSYTVATGAFLSLSGAHTLTSAATFTGSGTVTFTSGVFTIQNNYALTGETILGAGGPSVSIQYPSAASSTGKFSVNQGTLTISGDHTFAAGADISGAGRVTFTSGTINVNSAYLLTGETILNGSGLVVNITYSTPATSTGKFTITQGTLNISGSHTFVFPADFSGAGKVTFVSGTVVVKSNYNLTGTTAVSGADVNFSSALSLTPISTLQLSAGSVNFGNFVVSVDDFTWSGGTLSGLGLRTVNTSLDLSGSLTLTDSILVTSSLADVTIALDGSMSGNGTFAQTGTLTKTGNGTTFTFSSITYYNSGTINVNEGTLAFGQLHASNPNSDGTYNISSNGILDLGGPLTFNPGATIENAGTINFHAGLSGVININAAFNLTASGGTINVSSGMVSFNPDAYLGALGSLLSISGGKVNLSSGETPEVVTLSLSGGELTGTDNLLVTTLNWSNGTMSGAATTTVNVGGQLNFTQNISLVLNGRLLVNRGAAVWNRVSNDSFLYLMNGASFINDIGATFDIQAGGSSILSGSGLFTNHGTLTNSVSGTSSFYGVSFLNDGVVDVQSGVLEIGFFDPGLPANTGSYTAAANSTLRFAGTETYPLDASSQISGEGSVDFASGPVVISGTYDIQGQTQVSGGTVTFDSQSQITHLGSTLVISDGKLSLNSGDSISLPVINQSGGELAGTDPLSLDTMDWSGGNITGSGEITINVTFDYASSSTNPSILKQRKVTNNGTATVSGNNMLSMLDAAEFINVAGAILNIDTGSSYAFYGDGTLTNAGTINLKSGLISITTFAQTSGVINEEISGGTAGAGFGQIHATNVNLAGELKVGFVSYTPNANLKFDLMTYPIIPTTRFDTFTLVGNSPWELVYNPTSLQMWNPDSRNYVYLPLALK